jgi:tetratricopeptide (TPR) repeat protein
LPLIETIWAAFQGTFYLGIGVIAIPLGVGLLRRNPAWRKLALCAAVVQILVIGLAVYILYSYGEEFADLWAGLSAKIGPLLGKVVLGAVAVLAVAVLAVSIWSIRLLTRKDIKRLFLPNVNYNQWSRLFWATALVILLLMISRETGRISLNYYQMSQEGTSFRSHFIGEEENQDNSLALLGFEAPCLIEVKGRGEERYRVVTTFTVQRHGLQTSTNWEWKAYGGLATSQLSPSLRNGKDRIVVEIDKPQLSGGYWLPLFKDFTVEYRARIRGEGKYKSFQDEVNEKRDVTVTGLCSVYYLKQLLLAQAEREAFGKIMNSAGQNLLEQLVQRGSRALGTQDYDRAIEDFNEAIRLDPEYTDAYINRGRAWYVKKEYDKAIKDYDEAIRLEPKHNSAAYIYRGRAWYAKKEYDKAIEDYDRAIDAFNDNEVILRRDRTKYADAYIDRGRAWSAKKEYDKAIKDYDEAIRLRPKYDWAHFCRSVAQLLDRRPKAMDGFQAVLELQGWKGNIPPYAVVLGHFAARVAGDEAEAERFLKDAAGKLDETWPYPVVQFLRGDIDEAALLKLSTDDDKRTEARCFLGMDHALKGRKGEALAHFRWVKEHGNTTFIEYAIAVAELDQLERPAEGPER